MCWVGACGEEAFAMLTEVAQATLMRLVADSAQKDLPVLFGAHADCVIHEVA
jgi:hypothetical protein